MRERHLRPQVEQLLDEEPAVLVTGPRTAGKSTLLRAIVEQRGGTILDLDDAATRGAVDADPDGTLTSLPEPVLIDEYQRVPDCLIAVKAAIDHDRRSGRFLLTGSVRSDLLSPNAETLTGRVTRLELWPFSQGELHGRVEDLLDRAFEEELGDAETVARLRDLERSRDDYLELATSSGFPVAADREGASARRWLQSYAEQTALHDAAALLDLRRPQQLRRLLRLAAEQTADLVNQAELARQSGLSPATTAAYLDLLENVFLLRTIPAWPEELTAKQSKTAKLHVTDTGLAAVLLGLTPTRLRMSPQAGPLLESFVVNEVVKQLGWAATDAELFHFRDRPGTEVDLVLERWDGFVIGIHTVARTRVGPGDLRGLRLLRDRMPERFRQGLVLYAGQHPVELEDQLVALPVSALWA